MQTGTFLENQAVMIEGSHFAGVRPEDEYGGKDEATWIDAGGGYLIPGLTDGHVHLDVGAGNRPDFGDGPLYLASGITTVFNMRGDKEHLRWRDRVREGELLGPSIYSCGEFINEPYVKTPEDVRREVLAQKNAGFDFLKFHEYWDHDLRRYLTREGLSGEAYWALIDAAASANMPLTGHGPNHFQLALEHGQSFAHLNVLLECALLPENKPAYRRNGFLAQWSLAVLVLASMVAFIGRRKPLDGLVVLAAAFVLYVFFEVFWSMNDGVIYALLGLPSVSVVSSLPAGVQGLFLRYWKYRILALLQFVAGVGLIVSMSFWVPLFLKNTNSGVDRLIAPLGRQSTPVVTTMVVDTPEWFSAEHPDFKYIQSKTAKQWRALDMGSTSFWQRFLAGDLKVKNWHPILMKLVKKMDDAGAVLVLGTDAMGFPAVVPGESALYELGLMVEAGLSPFAALKTATLNPPKLVWQEGVFGIIAFGQL